MTSNTFWKLDNGCAPFLLTVLAAIAIPAQFTATLTLLPNFASALSSAFFTSSSLVTSHGANITLSSLYSGVFAFNACNPSPSSAFGKSTTTTFAPFFNKRWAVARPKPDAAPVTNAMTDGMFMICG